MGFSSLAAAKAAHLDPKDVWDRPKDAVSGKIFSAVSAAFRDTLSLSADWQTRLGSEEEIAT
jgi:hypothetical protein